MTRIHSGNWLQRHPLAGALGVGVIFGLAFAAFIAAADTHGARFALVAGLAIGLAVFAPYVWWRLRRQ